MNKFVIKCGICKGIHWTAQCPYKDKIGLLKDLPGTVIARIILYLKSAGYDTNRIVSIVDS